MADDLIEKAEAQFTEWFVKNYPGPDTIIGKPEWHAPRIFTRARAALEAVMQEGEPGVECDRERLLLTFFRGMDEDRQRRGFPPRDPYETYWMQTGEGEGHLTRVVDDYLPGIDALIKAGLVSRHPAPGPGELERLRAENERLRAIALGVIALEDEPDAYPSCDTERLIEQARDVLDGRRHPAAERLRALWIRNAEMREALEWYSGKVRDCRKIGPEGDAARVMLDADAGKRARAALAEGGRDE